ncbi:tryptophan biosynthesis modulator TrpM [Streptomyces sp. TP-A0874]|uniref:tryptophan biosynthesis modulator TrpM n=1 Tax=Streptomyces sp. TP-A0874 TaxID=549819 RepID=UPI000AC4D56F|nr:hypothetical protein [Streptomyces sp. TP-A0874]
MSPHAHLAPGCRPRGCRAPARRVRGRRVRYHIGCEPGQINGMRWPEAGRPAHVVSEPASPPSMPAPDRPYRGRRRS